MTKFCEKCEKKILLRIKKISKLPIDKDREFIITQLYYLIGKEYESRIKE